MQRLQLVIKHVSTIDGSILVLNTYGFRIIGVKNKFLGFPFSLGKNTRYFPDKLHDLYDE